MLLPREERDISRTNSILWSTEEAIHTLFVITKFRHPARVHVDGGMGKGIHDFNPMVYRRSNSYPLGPNQIPTHARVPVDGGIWETLRTT